MPTRPSRKLETFANPSPDRDYLIRHVCREYTAVCPVTGQPDFGIFVIDYVPDRWLLESKSLKLFMFSFRNHGAFHEDCTLTVGKRIAAKIRPRFLRVASFWNPRGGIPIDVFWETGKLPEGVSLPATGIELYRGR